MEASAELRWFWRDHVPSAVRTWFHEISAVAPGGGTPRTDEYVIDRGQRQLGIKARGGKPGVEVKGLVRVCAAMAAPPLARQAQIWCKWTSDTLTVDHLPRTAVRKIRLLRKFDANAEELHEVPLDAQERPLDSSGALPARGCHVELVSLAVDGKAAPWETLAFEAFGPIDTVEQTLHRTLVHITRVAGPHVESGQFLSYPEWLAQEAR